ncbi:MAG: class I SAM-dependent methyltransferase [Verrucomicrobiota bacterium]|nr:class I SAM-dependent methyltransferase [Chthoniobacterales bacterium]MDQ3315474.1 class I SAM-dependent methyltransferase [Verrucomicrobiota bacterium]
MIYENMEWIQPDLVRAFQAEETDAYRICTFRDGWVERYGSDVLVSYQTAIAQERLTTELRLWSLSVGFNFTRVFARFLPKQNSGREAPRLITGDSSAPLQAMALERGLRYGIDFGAGYSTGLFVDQRHNRTFVRSLRPKNVLNCFAYTCSFSVAAATTGAMTTSIDLSKKSLIRGRENFLLNGQPITAHRFVPGDVMEYLPRLARKGDKFDLIILDPPTFSRSKIGKAFQVERDFETLLVNALEVGERDCHVLLSTNCTRLDEHALEVMGRFGLKASRRAGTLHREAALPDFPLGVGASTVWLTLR